MQSAVTQPEYVHVVINHLPVSGLAVAMLALIIALAAKERTAALIGLALVGLMSLSAWPVYYFGQAGYDRVLSMSDDAGHKYLAYHQHLGERWIYLYFITAGVASLGCALAWKWPRALVLSSVLALLMAGASLASGIVIAKAGGAIRHREFRYGPPPKAVSETSNRTSDGRRAAGRGTPGPSGLDRCPAKSIGFPPLSGHASAGLRYGRFGAATLENEAPS
jgi:hypothetical protein